MSSEEEEQEEDYACEYTYPDATQEERLSSSDDDDGGIEAMAKPAIAKTFHNNNGSKENAFNSLGYRVLTMDTVRAQVNQQVREVCELLQISTILAKRILKHYRWRVEAITNALFEKGREFVLKAGLGQVDTVNAGKYQKETFACCLICSNDLSDANRLINSTCGHCFCRECWTAYGKVKIFEEKQPVFGCMADKCHAFVTEEVLLGLDFSAWERTKCENAFLDSFIEDNSRSKWCASVPCCGNVINLSPSANLATDCECTCHTLFCFQCHSDSHTPSPCCWAESWKQLSIEEHANLKFINDNCKPCPKCRNQIYKDGGCNLVVCKCGQALCWVCGQATNRAHTWDSIANHVCPKFRTSATSTEFDSYSHYHGRFQAHLHAAKEQKKAKNYAKHWEVVGVWHVVRMRKFLAWSYVFAFKCFAVDNSLVSGGGKKLDSDATLHQQELFEGLQHKLESTIETLSNLLDHEFNGTAGPDSRGALCNLVSATNSLALGLYDFTKEIMTALNIAAPFPNQYFLSPVVQKEFGLVSISSAAFSNLLKITPTTSSSNNVASSSSSSLNNKKYKLIELTNDNVVNREDDVIDLT